MLATVKNNGTKVNHLDYLDMNTFGPNGIEISDMNTYYMDEDIDEDGNDAFFDNDPFFAEPKKHNKALTKTKLIMMMPMMFFSMFIMFCRFIGEFMIDVIDDLRD